MIPIAKDAIVEALRDWLWERGDGPLEAHHVEAEETMKRFEANIRVTLLRELVAELESFDGQLGSVTAWLDYRDVAVIEQALTQRADALEKDTEQLTPMDTPPDGAK